MFSYGFLYEGRIMKLIVGLGNPGLTYKKTRHNIGFMFIESIEKDLKLDFKLDKKFKALICKEKINGEDVIFAKPITYMNNSGESVKEIVDFYQISTEDILVIVDDMDLPVGKMRIRRNGSSGGQKGLNSIITLLNTNEIKRIRIGIDKGEDAINHVLGKFTKIEKESIDLIMEKAIFIFKDYLELPFEKFMSKYN